MDKTTIKRKAIEATKEYLVMVAYLWVILGLFTLYHAVILAQDISILQHGIVVINALVLGKVMLIAKELRLGEVASERPLIYPTLRDRWCEADLSPTIRLSRRHLLCFR